MAPSLTCLTSLFHSENRDEQEDEEDAVFPSANDNIKFLLSARRDLRERR